MKGRWEALRAVVRREVRQMRQNHTAGALTWGLPVVAQLFFLLLFLRCDLHNLPIALCDQDHTPLSRRAAQMIEATPSAQIVTEVNAPEEGETLIRQGKVFGVVWIPEGFERKILRRESAPVVSGLSGCNLTTNGLLAKDLQAALMTLSAGISIQHLEAEGSPPTEARQNVEPLRMNKHILFNPWLNYGYYLAPVFMALMLLLFTMLTTLYSVGRELRHNTVEEWLATASGSVVVAWIGKLLPLTLWALLQAQVMFGLLFAGLELPMRGSWLLLEGATLLLILAYQAIALLLILLTTNMRLALSLGGGYAVMAFTFSGATFPTLAMYKGMRLLAEGFPFTPYVRLLIDATLRGAPVVYGLRDLVLLGIFIGVPFLCAGRMRRIFHTPQWIGKE